MSSLFTFSAIFFTTVPATAPGPEDLYDVINERYEKGSIVLTSNRVSSEWAEVFRDPLLASAGLDRLLDRAEVIILVAQVTALKVVFA